MCHKCTVRMEICQYGSTTRQNSQVPSPISEDLAQPQQQQQANEDSVQINGYRLLHHYSTATYLTLSDTPEVQHMMLYALMELAFDNCFLLHSIFALTALHKSHELAVRGHAHEAIQHKTLALSYHDKALHNLLKSETSGATGLELAVQLNPSAIFGFASLTSIYSFASIDTVVYTPAADPACLTGWISMIRGVTNIVGTHNTWERVKNGPLAAIAKAPDLPRTESLPDGLTERLDRIRESWVDANTDSVVHYTRALDLLRTTYHKSAEAACHHARGALASEVGVLFAWPAQVSGEFVSLLTTSDPPALVILAHFLVLLNGLEHKYWWVGKRPRFLMGLIDATLPTSPFWSGHMRWPLSQVMSNVSVESPV